MRYYDSQMEYLMLPWFKFGVDGRWRTVLGRFARSKLSSAKVVVCSFSKREPVSIDFAPQ